MSKAFETDKHGYRIKDVEAYIAENKTLTATLKDRIAELKKELEEKDAELKAFKQKQELIVKSIISAAEKAEQIEQLIKHKFAAEMAHLDAFHSQWLDYYKRLIEAHPLSDQLRPLGEFNRRMTAILTGDDTPRHKIAEAQEQFRRENERLAAQNAQGNIGGESRFERNDADNSQAAQMGVQGDNAQKKKYIGFIPVGEGADEIDMDDFDPEESIRQMLRRQASEDIEKAAKTKKPLGGENPAKSAKSTKPAAKSSPAKSGKPAPKSGYKSPIAATVSPQALGASDSGFSFEEALNPTQDLSDILNEIGLMLGSDDK